MRKNSKMIIALAACLSMVLSAGCSSGDVTEAAEQFPLSTISSEALPEIPAETAGSIEVLSFENPMDFSYSDREGDMVFDYKDGKWVDGMTSGIPVNQELFQSMADPFLHLHAIREAEMPESYEEYGLDDPEYSLYMTDSEKGIGDIRIGSQDENGNYYTLVNEKKVYLIAPEVAQSLIFDYDSLIVKDTLEIDVTAGDMESVVISAGGKETKYGRKDKDAMKRIADGLVRLRPSEAASYLATENELLNAELTVDKKTDFTAVFMSDGSPKTITIHIGGFANAENTVRYIQIEGSQMIFMVEDEIICDLLNTEAVTEE